MCQLHNKLCFSVAEPLSQHSFFSGFTGQGRFQRGELMLDLDCRMCIKASHLLIFKM